MDTYNFIGDICNIPKLQGVYLLISPSNKMYIGKAQNLYKRIYGGYSFSEKSRETRPITCAIKKYKWKNFKIKLLHIFETAVDNLELLALETAFIDFYNSMAPNGYNICFFGEDRCGVKHSIETKEKMSKAHKGKIMSEESKRKLRENHVGMLNKHHTKEARDKIGRSSSIRQCKRVKQINLKTNEIIKIWNSSKEAAISLNIKSCNIARAIHGRRRGAGGFKWVSVI